MSDRSGQAAERQVTRFAEQQAARFYQPVTGYMVTCRVCGAMVDHDRRLLHLAFHGNPQNRTR